MDTDNDQQEMQEIWKKFNKQGNSEGGVKPAPKLTPEEEKRRNRKQIGIYLLITFLMTYVVEIFVIMPMAQNADAQQQGNGQADAGSRASVHAADNSYGTTQNVVQRQSKTEYYLGVPGTYYERECRIAEMFGFEGFENGEARMHDEIDHVAHTGCFGYYMKRVEI